MSNIFDFQQVCYTYPGTDKQALDGFSVAIPKGKKTAVVGRNGAGKSTFFLHCNGLYKPKSGNVFFDEQPLDYSRKALRTLRQKVGIIFQNADDQLFSASVAQDISFGPMNLNLPESEVRQRVQEAAALCDIGTLLDRPTHALSGGEKARVALAGVLAMRPDVLLVDEPTSSLDPLMRRQVFTVFHRLQQQGKTIILATHEMAIARHWADFVIVLDAGRVLAADTPEVIFANEEILTITGLAEPWYKTLEA